jgi:hypothetical protein
LKPDNSSVSGRNLPKLASVHENQLIVLELRDLVSIGAVEKLLFPYLNSQSRCRFTFGYGPSFPLCLGNLLARGSAHPATRRLRGSDCGGFRRFAWEHRGNSAICASSAYFCASKPLIAASIIAFVSLAGMRSI